VTVNVLPAIPTLTLNVPPATCEGKINFNAISSSDATGFQLWRAVGTGGVPAPGEYSRVDSDPNTAGTQDFFPDGINYVNIGLISGTTYYYYAKAVNANGVSAQSTPTQTAVASAACSTASLTINSTKDGSTLTGVAITDTTIDSTDMSGTTGTIGYTITQAQRIDNNFTAPVSLPGNVKWNGWTGCNSTSFINGDPAGTPDRQCYIIVDVGNSKSITAKYITFNNTAPTDPIITPPDSPSACVGSNVSITLHSTDPDAGDYITYEYQIDEEHGYGDWDTSISGNITRTWNDVGNKSIKARAVDNHNKQSGITTLSNFVTIVTCPTLNLTVKDSRYKTYTSQSSSPTSEEVISQAKVRLGKLFNMIAGSDDSFNSCTGSIVETGVVNSDWEKPFNEPERGILFGAGMDLTQNVPFATYTLSCRKNPNDPRVWVTIKVQAVDPSIDEF